MVFFFFLDGIHKVRVGKVVTVVEGGAAAELGANLTAVGRAGRAGRVALGEGDLGGILVVGIPGPR